LDPPFIARCGGTDCVSTTTDHKEEKRDNSAGHLEGVIEKEAYKKGGRASASRRT